MRNLEKRIPSIILIIAGLWTLVFFSFSDNRMSDENLEYVAGNVVPCCRDCNVAKSARTSEAFLAHCERVVAHQKSLKP